MGAGNNVREVHGLKQYRDHDACFNVGADGDYSNVVVVHTKVTQDSLGGRVPNNRVCDFPHHRLHALFVAVDCNHCVPQLIQGASHVAAEAAKANYHDMTAV
jgi:hypothetical protein